MEDLAYKYTQLPTKRERERERGLSMHSALQEGGCSVIKLNEHLHMNR